MPPVTGSSKATMMGPVTVADDAELAKLIAAAAGAVHHQ